jgi:hypothetical protein
MHFAISLPQILFIVPGLAVILFTAFNQQQGRVCTRDDWRAPKESVSMFDFQVAMFYFGGAALVLSAFLAK